MASKKLSTDTSLANSYKLSRGVASVARPSAPTIGTATDGGTGNMSVTFTASTLGPTASSFSLTSSSGVTGSGASSPLTLQEVATGTYTYSVSGVNANGTGPSSAASNSVVVASVYGNSFESIATVVGSGGQTLYFTSIPSTYKNLQIRGSMKDSNGGTAGGAITAAPMYIRFNTDTGANYTSHQAMGSGTAATSYNVVSATYGAIGSTFSSANADENNMFSNVIIDIFNYTSTSQLKTVRYISGFDQNDVAGGSPRSVSSGSVLWSGTPAAIATIRLDAPANLFVSGSTFTLYGIKG